jgi:EAL domain-containing protein (putative c-di-GMP-specific phosphodiesterase class I)
MLDARLPETVHELLAKWHLPAHRLALEVTENSAMADPERAVRVIARLRQLGVATSIDDYGTGYSSLAYLRRLDVDELKIDRSFIKGLAGSPESALIVRSTIDLARNLGLRVIAEGVESPAEWALLEEMGCDSVQGFFLGRPMPADDLLAWIAKWRETHPGSVDIDTTAPALRVVA